MLPPWKQRPFEIANLLNPAFCSVVLRDAIFAYHAEKKGSMSFALGFLVLPIVLHEPTRTALPKRTDVTLVEWLDDNPEIIVTYQFAERTREMTPYTKEAVIFGMKNNIFNLDARGNFKPLRMNSEMAWPDTSKPFKIRKQSEFLGRWFAKSGEPSKIFRLLGILP